MGQVLHGSATTTEAVRRAIQASEESVRALARRYGISPTTVQKWRKRQTSADAPHGAEAAALHRAHPRGGGHHRRLSAAHAPAAGRLPLRPAAHHPAPDPLVAASLPAAPRHRPAARDRWRQTPGSRFKAYPIGFFHIDIAEVHTEEGRLYLFVAIDRTSKFAFAQLHERATRRIAADFLRALSRPCPTGSTPC